MRKLLFVGALAALALTGCQPQPKQETSANSPLDVRPVLKARPVHMLPPTHDVTPPVDPVPPTIVAAAPPPATPASHGKATANAPAKPGVAVKASAVSKANGNAYTVRKGDTLYRIARVEYGDGKKWTRIASANPGVMPQSLKVGQTILIP